METLTIVYMIAAMCAVMGILTAYLIYHNEQSERKDYYKYIWRKERAKANKGDYDLDMLARPVSKPRKKTPADETSKGAPEVVEDTPPVIPEPEPEAQVEKPPLYVAVEEPAEELVDLPANSPPTVPYGTAPAGIPEPPAPLIVVGGAAAGAALTFERTRKLPPFPPTPTPDQESGEKRQKKNNKNPSKPRRIDDFDDYRNGSPPMLPPPYNQAAPEVAQYTPPPQKPELFIRPSPPALGPRIGPTVGPRDGLEF